ncbi:hypothetical protein F5X99DRAFT_267697 [Biscogniauxia marginata]|nr:hypothetical protein F5X99DRAFT_267697 [Biscogniauxia marginata]
MHAALSISFLFFPFGLLLQLDPTIPTYCGFFFFFLVPSDNGRVVLECLRKAESSIEETLFLCSGRRLLMS